MGCRYGRDVDAVDGRGGIEGAEVARGDSCAAAYVEDFEGVRREERVHYAVVHQFEEVGGLAAQTSVLGGAVVIVFVSIAGQDAQAKKKKRTFLGTEGITSDLTRSHLLAGKLAHLKD